jgi:hypothetical protein
MRSFIAAIAATMLQGGCIHDAAPVTPAAAAPPPAPPPEMVWTKPGATNEEFQRTKAACILRMEEDETAIKAANPGNPWASLRAITVFPLCMRANGWVQVPKTHPTAAPAANSSR